jgi:hypothetical protein
MADTNKLKDMLDNLINNKPEQAQTVFHAYLKDKLTGVLGHEVAEVPQSVPTEPVVDNTNSTK